MLTKTQIAKEHITQYMSATLSVTEQVYEVSLPNVHINDGLIQPWSRQDCLRDGSDQCRAVGRTGVVRCYLLTKRAA